MDGGEVECRLDLLFGGADDLDLGAGCRRAQGEHVLTQFARFSGQKADETGFLLL